MSQEMSPAIKLRIQNKVREAVESVGDDPNDIVGFLAYQLIIAEQGTSSGMLRLGNNTKKQ